jgi:polyisoprenoid-binding protein YceI
MTRFHPSGRIGRVSRPGRPSAVSAGTRLASLPAFLALALATAPGLAATTWATDAAASKLTFVATLAGGELEGRFGRFTPLIAFDPANLPQSRFVVDIDVATADTGDRDRDDILTGKDFFDAGQWPEARFEATAFRAMGAGAFDATGELTVRNITREIHLPFTFEPAADGRSALLSGGTTVHRLEYGVGQGEWSATQWLGNDVRVHFELRLRRTPP